MPPTSLPCSSSLLDWVCGSVSPPYPRRQRAGKLRFMALRLLERDIEKRRTKLNWDKTRGDVKSEELDDCSTVVSVVRHHPRHCMAGHPPCRNKTAEPPVLSWRPSYPFPVGSVALRPHLTMDLPFSGSNQNIILIESGRINSNPGCTVELLRIL